MNEMIDAEILVNDAAKQLQQLCEAKQIIDPIIVGIRTGGEWVAERFRQCLKLAEPLGVLDISFYRDDFTKIGLHPQVKPSCIEQNINGRHIILVDDVLQTGRTIRAALNELFDYGRPASVTLVCLLELNGQELPIRADVVAKHITLKPDQWVKLLGPQVLEFKVFSKAE